MESVQASTHDSKLVTNSHQLKCLINFIEYHLRVINSNRMYYGKLYNSWIIGLSTPEGTNSIEFMPNKIIITSAVVNKCTTFHIPSYNRGQIYNASEWEMMKSNPEFAYQNLDITKLINTLASI